MTTWALVPLTPKDDTPARRARSTAGQSMPSAAMVNFDAPSAAFGVSSVKCRCCGMLTVLHGQNGLDETGDAGGRLQVARGWS